LEIQLELIVEGRYKYEIAVHNRVWQMHMTNLQQIMSIW
jgi:hypothetical protein